MRGMGLFFGFAKRNIGLELEDPHPVKNLGDDVHTGNAGLDGFSVLAKAYPGDPSPPVKGTLGRVPSGPSESWEQ